MHIYQSILDDSTMEYTPLAASENEIRVLTILPLSSTGEHRTTLSHIPLSEDSNYEALSYCWGDPNVTKTLYVGEQEFQATQNLYAALRQFSLDGVHTRLWVDAVCINQADLEERSQQVLRMRDIYACAKQTIVWLGEEVGKTNKGLKLIQLLATDRPLVHQDRRLFDSAYKGLTGGNSPSQFDTSWVGFKELFYQPYWMRTWIIQEFVVATQLKIQCGHLSVDFDQLRWAMNRFYSAMSPKARGLVLPIGDLPLTAVSQLLELRDRKLRGLDINMLTALQLSSKSLATDAKDKLYGLLGLTLDGHTLIPKPDYIKTMEAILEDFAKSLVVHNKANDIMFLRSYSPAQWVR
jgi:hypothetical protein